jgi:flagellar hook-associated protein 1 FlgK
MSVVDIFEIGRQGMQANRQALQTTSNNVANANTPGYNRQRPVFENHQNYVTDGVRLGGGVEVNKVIRVHDDFVQKQINEESKTFGELKMKADATGRLEDIVQNQGTQLNENLTSFFNNARELSANPEQAAIRTNLVESAKVAAQGFQKMNRSLEDMKVSLDQQLSGITNDVNEKAKEVARLNGEITRFESSQQIPNELYDRRDLLVKDLSRMTGYQSYSDERGQINLSGSGMGVLVNGNESNSLQLVRTPEAGAKSAGSYDIFLKTGQNIAPVTHSFDQGEIGGVIKVRDQVVNPTLEHLDQLAYGFSQSVNQVHKEGVGLDGDSQRGLFRNLETAKGASGEIAVDHEVLKNPDAVAAGFTSMKGDNRAALAIAELQTKGVMAQPGLWNGEGEKRFTLGESMNQLVGDVGTHARNDGQLFENQQSVMGQLENYHQSLSGVSLEEEAVNLIQYQTVFNASAKAMKVGDEMLQTILSLKS